MEKMKRIDNCEIVKKAVQEGIGYPETTDKNCLGYSHSKDEEPIDEGKSVSCKVYMKISHRI